MPNDNATIITCPNCETKNRVRPTPSGVPRCTVCKTLLPWMVEAGADTFDAEIIASVPVLVDFWAPGAAPAEWSRRSSSSWDASTPGA